MFAILATLSMSSLAHAQRGGQRGEGGPRGGQRGGQRPASPMMTALDANKDGKLSAEEIANAATALKTLDKNKDGVIDANELAPPRGSGGQGGAQGGRSSQMVERIMARDTDGDGKVSREEAGESRFFDRMDADSDGFVTKAEIENMAQQFGGRRGGGGGRGGAGGGAGRGGAGGGGRGAGPSTKENRPGFDE